MKNIAIIGLIKDKNIGDAIICESVEYLCKTVAPQHNYKLVDLKGRCDKYSIIDLLLKVFNLFFKRFKIRYFEKLRFKEFINEELKDIDLIIFAGGGIIECEYYSCDFYLEQITEYAEKHDIRVAYNAVGFNGDYNENIVGYKVLQKVLNSRNVVSVTVRENPAKMNNQFLQNRKATLVSDPAVWSSECYNIKKEEDSDVIGINLIRPEIFRNYGFFDVSEDDVINFLSKIIEILNKDNQKWQFFTNGYKLDYDFGIKLLQHLNITEDQQYIKQIPATGKQFMSDIAEYKGIICFRLHASICSFSLGIPSIALLWNPKQKYFYENIGCGERCLELEVDKTIDILSLFEKAIKEGYNGNVVNSFKNTSKDSLEKLLKNDC